MGSTNSIDQSDYSFKCEKCGNEHELILCFGSDKPHFYFSIPEEEINDRVEINNDLCVIDQEYFFIRGRLTVPIIDNSENLEFNVWTSLSKENFERSNTVWNNPSRVDEPPYFGWLQTVIPGFSNTLNIKTLVHTNEVGHIPSVEVVEEDHPLRFSQQEGISMEKALKIVTQILHS